MEPVAWACHVCTFAHENLSLAQCDMCGSKRPVSSSTTNSTTQQTLSFSKHVAPAKNVIDLTQNYPAQKETAKPPSRKRKVPPTSSSKPTPTVASIFQSKLKNNSTFPVYTLPKTQVFSKKDIQTCLRNTFQLESLRRNLQLEAVQNALRQESQLLVLATGGGKSLCYQLPACLLGGVTIVVSPLIALMQDQIASLTQKGIPAAHLSSQQTVTENNQVLAQLLDTKDKPLTLLYITPESIQTDKMRNILQKLQEQKRLSMFAIDEAHCLSSWGHDFRPSYRKLTYLRTQFPKVPCMACTATATPQVLEDLQKILHLETAPLLKGSFDRPNIFYKVLSKDTGSALDDMVQWISKQHQQHASKQESCSGIVYVHKRQDTDFIARKISSMRTVVAAPYHAGLKKDERNRVLEEWSCNKIQVAVATVAFGMGIDLAHVRYVIHWTLPKTIEGFYQEAGRAGRDGLPSHSLLYYSPGDVGLFQFLLRKQRGAESKLKALEQMVSYCTTPQCRRNALIRHFGGAPVPCQKTCDFCRNPKKVERIMQQASIVGDVLGGHNKSDRVWNGKKKQKGDFDYEEDDEDAIARDWGDEGYTVGDLRVTGGLDYGAEEEYSAPARKAKRSFGKSSVGFVKASSLARTSRGAGFTKASAVLDRLEKMEQAAGLKDDFENERPARAAPIPEHFRVAPSTTATKAQSMPAAPTSKDHGAKAEKLRLELEALEAEREKRMKALIAKRRVAKS